MFCPAGTELFREFENATENRADARDDVLRSQENRGECEEGLFAAKQRYGEAFVAWVAHRACCVGCRALSLPHDLEQFASV